MVVSRWFSHHIFTFQVYVKITCPDSWPDESIARQCRKSVLRLESEDIFQIIPVTDTETNITYGNKYCAICHGRSNYKFWKVTKYCGEAPPNFLTNIGEVQQTKRRTVREASSDAKSGYTRLKATKSYKKVHRKQREVGSHFINALIRYMRKKRDTGVFVDYTKYVKKVDEIWNTTTYDPNSGYFVTKYENKGFICDVAAKLPFELKAHVRTCVPNMIENCAEEVDGSVLNGCKNHTSIVYNKKDNKVYRNKFCASCNRVSPDSLTGCPITVRDESIPLQKIPLALVG